MLLVDGRGTPLGVDIASASPAEVKLIEPLLNKRTVRKRPQRLIYDKAADSDPLRKRLAKRCIELICPHRSSRQRPATGGAFPKGREYNFTSDGAAAAFVVQRWPTPVVFSGYEIGSEILTGAGLRKAAQASPVRRAYELYNGLNNRPSWDQTAVLYAIRGLDCGLANYWAIKATGRLTVKDDGSDVWRASSDHQHAYLVRKGVPARIAEAIEELMLQSPAEKR
jgi:hypothetical protein